jgi:hypothetical protein
MLLLKLSRQEISGYVWRDVIPITTLPTIKQKYVSLQSTAQPFNLGKIQHNLAYQLVLQVHGHMRLPLTDSVLIFALWLGMGIIVLLSTFVFKIAQQFHLSLLIQLPNFVFLNAQL